MYDNNGDDLCGLHRVVYLSVRGRYCKRNLTFFNFNPLQLKVEDLQ